MRLAAPAIYATELAGGTSVSPGFPGAQHHGAPSHGALGTPRLSRGLTGSATFDT